MVGEAIPPLIVMIEDTFNRIAMNREGIRGGGVNRKRRRRIIDTHESCQCETSTCHHDNDGRTIGYNGPARRLFVLCIIVLCINHTMALLNVEISTRRCNLQHQKQTHDVSALIRLDKSPFDTSSIVCFTKENSLESFDGDNLNYNDQDYLVDGEDDDSDSKGSRSDKNNDEEDDDDYFESYISDAFNEGAGGSSSSTKSEEDITSSSSDNTKSMIDQQQKQIDMLMKLVQQQQKLGDGGQQQSSSDRIPDEKSAMAPLKAMLFIDGTWLYYSINGRNAKHDAIIPKFGMGWQNNYKVDWRALPRLICAQIEKQKNNSNTSFASGSDRPLEIARAMVFTSAKKETDPNSIRMRMFREMADANYDVHMMETVGQGEKCVDIQLAVEMLHYATVPNAYDVAILLSGDKDFVPALVRTRQKGKQVCISSMRAGCNRVLYESPHIRDYDIVWLENCLDELIVPISAEERGRRDRAGYASSFTMMRVVRDFIESAPVEWVSSRDIGRYLKNIDIADSNMLEELKQAHGGLRTFLMERALTLFEVEFPDNKAVRGRGEFSFFVRVKENSDDTLLNEFKRTQFFTKEEKEFLESYKKDKYTEIDSFDHTMGTSSYKKGDSSSVEQEEDFGLDLESPPAINYSQLTVAKLKDICRDKSLPVTGKKDVLIERLEEDRRLEHEVIEKLQQEARAAKRTFTKKLPRPKAMMQRTAANQRSIRSKPALPSMDGSNIYSSTLPQMDYRSPRGNNNNASTDPAVSTHLLGLITEYLTASGGEAGSRDIGRYLAVNSDSRKGQMSALTELKENYGSLLTCILSQGDTFSVLDKPPGHRGDEKGFPIRLN